MMAIDIMIIGSGSWCKQVDNKFNTDAPNPIVKEGSIIHVDGRTLKVVGVDLKRGIRCKSCDLSNTYCLVSNSGNDNAIEVRCILDGPLAFKDMDKVMEEL